MKLEAIELNSQQTFRLLRWQESLHEVESILSPTQRTRLTGSGDQWHFHPEMELTIVQHGSGTSFVGDHIGPFDSLDVVLIGSNVPHFWKIQGRSSGYALQWRFGEQHPFWQFPESRPLHRIWKQAARGLRFRGDTADSVFHLVQQMAAHSGLRRFSILLEIFDLIATAPKRDSVSLSSRSFDLSEFHIHQPAIERVIRHILKHYSEAITLAQALRLSGMSRATFARQFGKHVGKSFSAFINQVRLDAARRELLMKDTPVSEAAFASGFNSLSYFNRAFLKAYGCSPKVYRKKAA